MTKNEKEKILEAFQKSDQPITPVEAAHSAGVNKNTARWSCLQLHKESKLERISRGHYKFKKS